MNNFFDSVYNGQISVSAFFLVLGVAVVCGFLFSFLCSFRIRSSKRFFITTALLPAAVATVIALVNGNVGTGIAIAGAFSLVRFRSAQGNSEEIGIVFVTMTSGLAFGMGYIAYGVLILLIMGFFFFVFESLNVWKHKNTTRQKTLKITIPEDLNYGEVLSGVLQKYTRSQELIRVKTVNMGSMYKLTYSVVLKHPEQEKQMIDDLRCLNGNLEVELGVAEVGEEL